jgi:hypothetical protein
MNASQFCSGFQWVGTDDAGRLVTPWRYDDGDQVVVFARREGSEWRVDDNGEGLFRLAAAGVDPESPQVVARLSAFPTLLGVHVEDDGETLGARSEALEPAALAVAEASSQVMALACLRRERPRSGFREQVVQAVRAAAASAGVEARFNVPVDDSQSLTADVYLSSPVPLIVIAATSAQRLMEAEIIWLDAARRQEPAYVLAAVEDVRAVGISQYTRANYYTDKTVEFTGAKALGDLVAYRLRH